MMVMAIIRVLGFNFGRLVKKRLYDLGGGQRPRGFAQPLKGCSYSINYMG